MNICEVHRLDDGPIDFNFYRAQALAARREMVRNVFKHEATFGSALITLMLIVGVTVAALASRHLA